MRIPRLQRYSAGARIYDLISGERPVYRPGRLVGVEQAGLAAGARVLDLGCGTGLNLTPLQRVVGPGGAIVGVDASPSMLRAARRRCHDNGWTNIDLRRGDAGRLVEVLDGADAFDAVIVTYALSIIRDWRGAFEQALAALRPGGRMVVVDMSYPTGRWLLFAPLAALAFVVGGVHPHRAPWRLVDEQTVDVRHTTLRGGHVHVAVGTKP